MELDALLAVMKEIGYVGIFLWLWLGMLGVPIPNEAIVTSIGFMSTTNFFEVETVFFVAYLGIVASLTTSYSLGRIVGHRLITYFSKRKGPKRSIRKASHLIKKYHIFSLVISYFIPGVRIFVPFLFGMMRFSFLRFAALSYTTAFVWFCLFFFLGKMSGMYEHIAIYVTLLAIAVISIFSFIFNWVKKRKKRLEEQVHG